MISLEWAHGLDDPLTALRAVEVLLGVSVTVQALGLWRLASAAHARKTWRWRVLRAQFPAIPAPILWGLDRIMPARRFRWLGPAMGLAGLTMIVVGGGLAAAVSLCITMLAALRWRGSVNGGSDSMTLIALACVTVARLAGATAVVTTICLGYLALQTVASYLIAGVVKLRAPAWRRGSALCFFVEGAAPGPLPPWIQRPLRGPLAARLVSWGLIGFEVLSPLALVAPEPAVTYCGFACCFHLLNTACLGLHRFLWAWLATYPAVIFLSQQWAHTP